MSTLHFVKPKDYKNRRSLRFPLSLTPILTWSARRGARKIGSCYEMPRKTLNERFARIFEELTDDKEIGAYASRQKDLAAGIMRMEPMDELKTLLARGAQIDEPVVEGLRPLHFAIFQSYHKAAKLLISRGCDVNVPDDLDYTPLHIASEAGSIEMVELLLDHDAQINNFHPDAPHPLHLAVKNRHTDVARTLLDRGADAEIDLVADLESLEPLLEAGANPNSRDRAGLSPLMKAARQAGGMEAATILLKFGANVNGMSGEENDHKTVLHYAVLSGNHRLIEMLIQRGANPNYHEKYDLRVASPLHLAVLKGAPKVVQLLIRSGANLNWSSPVLGAPLHVAASGTVSNGLEIIQVLLEAGADPNLKVLHSKFDGRSQLRPPLVEYLASNSNPRVEIVALLIKYGARVVMKTQFRDPDGVLNHLFNVTGDEGIFGFLLEACESFDTFMIRRDRVMSQEQKRRLLVLAESPLSLKRQVRLFLRRFLGGKRMLELVGSFKLPRRLEKYLLFDGK